MDFDLSSEQKMLQHGLAEFLGESVDAAQLVQMDAAQVDGLRNTVDSALFDMGLAGILVEEAQGGLDMGLLTLAVVAEELGRHAAPSSVIRNALAAWIVSTAGDEAQKARWLADLMRGAVRAAFAVQEGDCWSPDALASGSHVDALERRNVEGGGDADLFIVALGGGRLGLTHGVGVARKAPRPDLDVTRPLVDITIRSEAVEPLRDYDGLAVRLRDAQLALLAADAYGAGLCAFEMTVEYAKTRTQFDRPIGAFQAIKHQLANMALEIHPARYLAWYAAHAWDALPGDVGHAAALAKAHVADVAVRTARATVEAHGGIGYTWEYPLHLFLKRAMFDRAVWGGVEEHRNRVAEFSGW